MTSGPNSTVTLCQHGNRRVVSVDTERRVATLVERFEGKRLNSPNDVVYRADGGLYFSDPPYGLPQGDQDPQKDLRFNGVFRYENETLHLLTAGLTRPNGLAFSPDQRVLYVANSDESHRCWMRYELAADGSVAHKTVFRDVSTEPAAGLPDGMKLDASGNIFATGPGGVWVMTPNGAHLGTLNFPEQPANLAWGDDGATLYVTAETGLYRVRTAVQGQPLVYR
jgi:gluconolactonase